MNLELELRLKELVSGKLPGLVAATRSAFGNIDRIIGGTQKSLNDLGKTVSLKIDSSGITSAQKDIDRLKLSYDNLRSESGGRGAGGFISTSRFAKGAFYGNLAAQGVMTMGRGLLDQGKSVLNTGMEGSMQKSQFEVMAGEKRGQKLYRDLTQYIQESVFGNSLYKNATELMGFGDDPRRVMPDLKMLGDVSRGDTNRMNSLSLVYGQSMGAGKLMGGDLNQYIQAGFNPLQEMSRTTGKSYATLREEMSDGKITFDKIRAAFKSATSEVGRFYGMLDKIGKTPFGKWEAMKGNIDNAKLQLGTALLPAISGTLDVFKKGIDELPSMMDRMAPTVNKIFREFDELLPHMKGFSKGVYEDVKPLGGFLMSDNFKFLMKSSLDLGKTMAEKLKPTMDGLADSFKGLASVVGSLFWVVNEVVRFEQRFIKKVDDAGFHKTAAFMGGGTLGLVHYGANKYGGPNYADQMGTPTKLKSLVGGMLGRNLVSAKDLLKGIGDDAKATATKTSATDETSDAIIGGGRKAITINNHAPLYQVNGGQIFQSIKDHIEDFEPRVQEAFLRLLQGANAAM